MPQPPVMGEEYYRKRDSRREYLLGEAVRRWKADRPHAPYARKPELNYQQSKYQFVIILLLALLAGALFAAFMEVDASGIWRMLLGSGFVAAIIIAVIMYQQPRRVANWSRYEAELFAWRHRGQVSFGRIQDRYAFIATALRQARD